MDGGNIFPIFFLFAIFAILVRLSAGRFDRDRVRRYIEDQGGEFLDARWTPFGSGWRGEKDSRIYRVEYRDRYGNIREATVKTSFLSGVYFTDDVVVVPAEVPAPVTAPATASTPTLQPAELAELEQLREQNARLRQELAQSDRIPNHCLIPTQI